MTHSQYLAELSRIRISGSVIDAESLTKTEYLERKGRKAVPFNFNMHE